MKLPNVVLALRMASTPSFVRGPVDAPACHLHLDALLVFMAGCLHCFFDRELIPAHLRHLILPPAVINVGSGSVI